MDRPGRLRHAELHSGQRDVALHRRVRERRQRPGPSGHGHEQLDSNLDWSTFQLGSFGFGSVNVFVPAGLTQYQQTVNYQNPDGSSLNVLVSLLFNVQTGLLSVSFTSLDPITGQAPRACSTAFCPPTMRLASAKGSSSTP